MFQLMCSQMKALAESCPLPLPALSNCAALLWTHLERINWAGFYLIKDETLYLGPFQGKVACTIIPVGKGVCGTAAKTREIQLVSDVHQFPGHIACDSASNSEIVLPLIVNEKLVGVMDIDSPDLDRFSRSDVEGLAALCQVLVQEVNWEDGLL